MTQTIEIKEYSDNHKNEIIDLILNIQNNEFNIAITSEQQPDLHDIRAYYQKGCGQEED